MAEMFKVQQGGSPPAVDRARKAGRRKFPVETMGVDEWFFVPGREVRSVSAYVSRITKQLPGKFITRAVAMVEIDDEWRTATESDHNAVRGVQVWRVE